MRVSNGLMAREARQTALTFLLVILTSIILIILFCTKHGAHSFMSPSFKNKYPNLMDFVPTKNCPEYGVKAQEIPLFVCNTSDALIGWFEFNGNGKFQIFPQTEINITQMLNNIISQISPPIVVLNIPIG